MHKLMKIFDHMNDALEEAEEYAKCAMQEKALDDDIASKWHSLAKQEIEAAEKLDEMAKRHIKKHIAEDEMPKAAKDICEYESGKFAKRLAKAKAMMETYNK